MRRVCTADSYLSEEPRCENGSLSPPKPTANKTTSAARNVFTNLSIFFHQDKVEKGKRGSGRMVDLTVRGDTSLLPSLLEDMLQREMYTADDLVDQLLQFITAQSQSSDKDLWLQQEHVAAVYQTVAQPPRWGLLREDTRSQVIRLVSVTPGAFERLFYSVLSTSLGKCTNVTERKTMQIRMGMLQNFMKRVDSIRNDREGQHFMDKPLSFGETALDVASRHRNPDAVMLLLRHGVKVQTNWMNYRSSLEVLLFSPTVIFLDKDEERNLEECLMCFLRAERTTDLRELADKAKSGYYPLHGHWRDLIPEFDVLQPQSLMQSCRCQIRDTLLHVDRLPDGPTHLPLPRVLIDYLDLQH